jgi:DNA-binding PadR family transcriptional regulator
LLSDFAKKDYLGLNLTDFHFYVYIVDMADLLGTFEQSVLLTVLRLGDEAYGRAILNQVQKVLERDVSAGSVYTTLYRLETRGLVESKLADGTSARGGRARRYYTVAADGARALNDARTTLTAMWANVTLPTEAQP